MFTNGTTYLYNFKDKINKQTSLWNKGIKSQFNILKYVCTFLFEEITSLEKCIFTLSLQ